jgi:hypothetical protein
MLQQIAFVSLLCGKWEGCLLELEPGPVRLHGWLLAAVVAWHKMHNCPETGLVAGKGIVMVRMVEAHIVTAWMVVEAHIVMARMVEACVVQEPKLVLGLEPLGL